jgi:hypothetical protein
MVNSQQIQISNLRKCWNDNKIKILDLSVFILLDLETIMTKI